MTRIFFITVVIFLTGITSTLLSAEVSADFSVSPPYQYVSVSTASDAATINQAYVEFRNGTELPTSFTLSLAHIQATDVLGRLQFNAPLPQTVVPSETGVAMIEPESLTLDPGEIATVSVQFNPERIEPGKTAYLLLGKLGNSGELGAAGAEVVEYISSVLIVRDPTTMIPQLQLTQFPWPSLPIRLSLPDYLTMYIKNVGTAATPPRGLVQLTDQFNRELYRGPVNEAGSSILPNSERAIYARLTRSHPSFPVALVTLTATFYDHEHRFPTTITKRFVYLNLWVLPGLLAISSAVYFLKKRG